MKNLRVSKWKEISLLFMCGEIEEETICDEKEFKELSMKTSNIILGLFILITVITINNASAQEKCGCKATANQIYFVASGQSVTDVHPGSNGGNGYQLNILGTGVDNFELVQERYMTSVSIIPNYTNSTSAKWQVFFAANMGRTITHVRLRNKCTGETNVYRLTSRVRLLDQ